MVAIENKRITFSAFISLLLLFWLCKLDCNNQNGWHYVPFEESMAKVGNHYEEFMRKGRKRFRHINFGMRNIEVFYFFRDLYEKNKKLICENKKQGNIPKIIHQIWLGSELPERYKNLAEGWKKYHPDWEYRLWTDKDVETFDMHNRDLFEKTTNYGGKSDIWRCEILYQHGGLYIDTDFECLKNFDMLNENFEFYCGVEPLAVKIILGNAIIASIPGHPILKRYLEQMRSNAEHIKKRSCINGKRRFSKLLEIALQAGPFLLTKVFIETVKRLSVQEHE